MHYKFNGKLEQRGNPDYSGELDQETGLYYYGARYYDPQISMWYGVDPKADKYPMLSPYMYTAGNPVILKDPDGREIGDYYNEAGKYVGTDNIDDNKIYITTARSPETFKSMMEVGGVDYVKKYSRLVTVQTNVKESVQKIYKESNANNVERKAYFVLNTQLATLTIEEQPRAKTDNNKHSDNYYTKDKENNCIFISGEPHKIIVGQLHGHPDPPGTNATYSSSELKPGVSIGGKDTDDVAAKTMGVPVHAIDYTGKVSRVIPSGDINPDVPQTSEMLIQSLEISGGKSK